MHDKSKHVTTLMCYFTGVKDEILDQFFDQNLLESLRQDRDAVILHNLCKIRTSLFRNFNKINNAIKFNMVNLDRMPDEFDEEDINWLEKNGYPILKPNYLTIDYISDISVYINSIIYKYEKYFPDWIKWEIIKSLFVIPQPKKIENIKKELTKYNAAYRQYPYQAYIYWQPNNKGCLFFNDDKFLTDLYELNGYEFKEKDKITDATHETKEGIYDFVDRHDNIEIVVDCENSDACKFYSVIKNLSEKKMKKIKRIIMFDDFHTAEAWEILQDMLPIPVSHIDVERVLQHKSLVDIRLTAEVVKDYYENNIQGFIVFSSDSDYWGLISSLPDAEFLMMYEDEKSSEKIKHLLQQNHISYCKIDDFCTGNIDAYKKRVLLSKFEKYTATLLDSNLWELTKRAYDESRIKATEEEKLQFYLKYIKTVKLHIDDEGNPSLVYLN